MGLSAPWIEYKSKQFFTNMTIKLQTTLTCIPKHLQELTQWALVPLWLTLTYKAEKLKNLSNYLEENQCIYVNR